MRTVCGRHTQERLIRRHEIHLLVSASRVARKSEYCSSCGFFHAARCWAVFLFWSTYTLIAFLNVRFA